MKSILILRDAESNTGYPIGPLEATLSQVAMAACSQDGSRVHFAYPSMPIREYVYRQLNIPRQRRVFFCSGHMEPRKGVAVIMQAANRLAQLHPQDDWQIALFDNKDGDEQPLVAMLSGDAAKRVLFGGYRNDIDMILPGCHAGIIASTRWDSFPRSAMEMQAVGLPLVVSKLPGLRESIEDGQTGVLFEPGDHEALAVAMNRLLEDDALHHRMAGNARQRMERKFSLQVQFENLLAVVNRIAS